VPCSFESKLRTESSPNNAMNTPRISILRSPDKRCHHPIPPPGIGAGIPRARPPVERPVVFPDLEAVLEIGLGADLAACFELCLGLEMGWLDFGTTVLLSPIIARSF
jgi:hypothetical protein